MKLGEKGFTYIELVIAIAITVLVSGAASIATFQVFKGTERNNNYITTVRQVQNAGYWICRDAWIAQSATTDNLTPPDFLILRWTELDDPDNPVYHSATYFFEDLTGATGKLKRSHWSSAGANEETLIAEHIYYDPDDPDDTSKANYQGLVLTVQLTSLIEDDKETREYKIIHRPKY